MQALYLRQSIDRAGDELAVSRQREDLLRLCKQRGWTDVQEYADNDFSASVHMPGAKRASKPRPAFQRLMADVESGRVSAIAVWDADRLYRHPRELEDIIDLADKRGLELATVGGDFDLSTPTGRGNARMKGVFARMEMEQKSVRQKRAARQHAEHGKAWGGRRPFGYEQGAIRADEATLIRAAYTAILAEQSLHSIAAQWNQDGVTTTIGNRWSGSTVRQMLLNPRYCGKRAYKGEVVADATWEPIVSQDVWRSVQVVLTDARRRRNRAPGRKYLLTGILQCGRCNDGTTMGSGVAGDDGEPIYVCKHCHRLSRRLHPVDKLVVKLAVAYLSQPDNLAVLVNVKSEDAAALQERERALLDTIDGLAVDRAKGLLTGRQVKIATDAVEADLKDVRGRMRDTNRGRVFDGLEDAVARGAVQNWWEALLLDRQRAIIDTIMAVKLQPSGRGRPFRRDHLDLKWVAGDD